MCCSSPGVNLICNDGMVQNGVNITPFLPSSYFSINCNNDTQVSNNISGISKCISGNLGCSCEDKAFCRCISLGQEIELIPVISLNDSYCPGDFTVKYFINDIEDTRIIINSGNYQSPLALEFDTKGKYVIRQEVTNCCGTCTYTQEIIVGASVEFERIDCLKFRVNDYYNHSFIGEKTLLIDVMNHKLEVLNSWKIEEYSGDQEVLFSLPSDGVYVVSYKIVDNLGVIIYEKTYCLYELCGVYQCYESLLLEKIYKNDCKDPEVVKLESDINYFMSVFIALKSSIDVQLGITYGNLEYDEKYLGIIGSHQFLINELTKLCSDKINKKCASC